MKILPSSVNINLDSRGAAMAYENRSRSAMAREYELASIEKRQSYDETYGPTDVSSINVTRGLKINILV